MLGRLIKSLVVAILEERALYEGNGIVTNAEHAHERVRRLTAELDKFPSCSSWLDIPNWMLEE
jgi:hypothetical protein